MGPGVASGTMVDRLCVLRGQEQAEVGGGLLKPEARAVQSKGKRQGQAQERTRRQVQDEDGAPPCAH